MNKPCKEGVCPECPYCGGEIEDELCMECDARVFFFKCEDGHGLFKSWVFDQKLGIVVTKEMVSVYCLKKDKGKAKDRWAYYSNPIRLARWQFDAIAEKTFLPATEPQEETRTKYTAVGRYVTDKDGGTVCETYGPDCDVVACDIAIAMNLQTEPQEARLTEEQADKIAVAFCNAAKHAGFKQNHMDYRWFYNVLMSCNPQPPSQDIEVEK